MNYLKRSLMAIAGSCIIASSSFAYTFGETFKHPVEPNYTISFFELPNGGIKSDPKTAWGKCSFCWYTDCWNYNYYWDGVNTIIVEKIGVFYLINNVIYGIPFTMEFKN